MKFSTSYEATVRENAFLRSLAKNLILVVISALTIVFLSYDRTPMMVERTAHGMEIIHPTELKNGEEDVKTAITLQIKARFDSDVRSPEVFLAPKQLLLRDAEQKELKSHGMTQTVIVRKIAITKNDATVDR